MLKFEKKFFFFQKLCPTKSKRMGESDDDDESQSQLPSTLATLKPSPLSIAKALAHNASLTTDVALASARLLYPACIILQLPLDTILQALLIFQRSSIMWPFGELDKGGVAVISEHEGEEEDMVANRDSVPDRVAVAIFLACKEASIRIEPSILCLVITDRVRSRRSQDPGRIATGWNRCRGASQATLFRLEPRVVAAIGYNLGFGAGGYGLNSAALLVAYSTLFPSLLGADGREPGARLFGRALAVLVESIVGSLWLQCVHDTPAIVCAVLHVAMATGEEETGRSVPFAGDSPGEARAPSSSSSGKRKRRGSQESGDEERSRDGAIFTVPCWWNVFDVENDDFDHCLELITTARETLRHSV